MAERIRFLVGSVLDTATVSASTICSGIPKENVQTATLAQIYRATGHTHEWLRFDAGAATTANAVFVAGHNFSTGATVKIEANISAVFTGAALSYTFDMPTDGFGGGLTKLFHCWATNQSYRYWRLYVSDTAGATCIEVGRIMVGRYIEPTRNIREKFSLGFNDPSTGIQTVGRQGYYSLRPQRAQLAYEVIDAKEDQFNQLAGIYAEVGQHTPFVVAIDPTTRPHHNTFYMKFAGSLPRRQSLDRRSSLGPILLEEST